MNAAVRDAVLETIEFLRVVPKWSAKLDEAQALFEELRSRYPALELQLLPHLEPQQLVVDYDVLVQHPEGGIVSVNFTPEEGVPWCVLHAEHWAANLVATVDDEHVTMQRALLFFKHSGPLDLMSRLVDMAIVRRAARAMAEEVSDEEVQEAADAYRETHGLGTAARTQEWLREHHLTLDDFETLVRDTVAAYKLKERVAGGQVAAYFETHRARFEAARVARIRTADPGRARAAAQAAREPGGLLAAAGRCLGDDDEAFCGIVRIADLPAPAATALAPASAGDVIGPLATAQVHEVYEVLGRPAVRLDESLEREIKDAIFADWLAAQRGRARVVWHWM